MATKVKKTIYRETIIRGDDGGVFWLGKYRPVIISIEPPNVIGFRLKGTHKTVYLTAEGCYVQALKVQLAAEKKAKAKEKKNKRGRR